MLTPLEIHNKEFKKAFRGYEEEEVDEFLDQVISDYEQLYKENLDLREMLNRTEGNIGQYKDLEDTLKNALVVAQQTSDQMRSNAEKEAEMIVQEGKAQAERIVSEAHQKYQRLVEDHERLKNQIVMFRLKLKSFLEMQMAMVDEYGESIQQDNVSNEILTADSSQPANVEIKADSQLDELSSASSELKEPQLFLAANDFDSKVHEAADQFKDEPVLEKAEPEPSPLEQLNNYDFMRAETEQIRQKTIMYSKEEIAAAIENGNVEDKTIY